MHLHGKKYLKILFSKTKDGLWLNLCIYHLEWAVYQTIFMYERLLHVQLGCEISRLSHVTFNAVTRSSSKLGHLGSKTRSPGQIRKPC